MIDLDKKDMDAVERAFEREEALADMAERRRDPQGASARAWRAAEEGGAE